MAFNKQAPEWGATGIEPPESKRNLGWEVEDRPPAAWLNWFMNLTAESLQELQIKAAEKTYVEDKIAEAIAGVDVDIPDASLSVKGITQLNSAVNSTSEKEAATPKAVKMAYDEAQAGKQAGNERKAEVVAALVAKGIPATTSESWATLIPKITAIVTATGNAVLADVLAGKTFSTPAGNAMVGTMPDNRGVTLSPTWQEGITAISVYSGTNQGQITFNLSDYSEGYVNKTTKGVLNVAGLVPEAIAAGYKVGNPSGAMMTGTFTSDATATAAQILAGQTAYKAGAKVTGTMPNRGGGGYQGFMPAQASPTAGVIDVKPLIGAWDGATYGGIQDLNYVAHNIKKDVWMWGLRGTMPALGTLQMSFNKTYSQNSAHPAIYEDLFTLPAISNFLSILSAPTYYPITLNVPSQGYGVLRIIDADGRTMQIMESRQGAIVTLMSFYIEVASRKIYVTTHIGDFLGSGSVFLPTDFDISRPFKLAFMLYGRDDYSVLHLKVEGKIHYA